MSAFESTALDVRTQTPAATPMVAERVAPINTSQVTPLTNRPQAQPRSTSSTLLPISEIGDVGGVKLDLDAEKIRSFIADGDEIQGNLVCKTGICISGTINGDVTCESGAIVVLASGRVKGNLTGKEKVIIDGGVGDSNSLDQNPTRITTPGMVVLQTNAVVNANIEYGKLATYGDMTHNGSSRKINPAR